ncbi:DUF4435 domain-containing protein [Oceanospirillum beijerinckii]|uniref:DUF4435 domain-containing protein n=1 Tax=Oceanospirillum beijerinckii TaxID=64976 RepID=UPI0003FD9E1F|nr:DUF4435 domain-containing protein [Oceanospirillum beijerinckii]
MRQYLSNEARINELRMLMKKKKYRNKLFILLEGTSDIRLFRSLLNRDKVVVDSMDGKGRIEQIVRAVDKVHQQRVKGICDADYDHLNGRSYASGLILLTDSHDIEAMMLGSPALDAVISEYASPEYYDALHRQLLKKALEVCYEIGLLRWINDDENLFLSFKELDFRRFTTINNLKIDFDRSRVIPALLSISKSARIQQQALEQRLEEYREREADPFQVCAGHDLTRFMAMVMNQQEVGMYRLDGRGLESALRLAYQIEDFEHTQLFEQLSDWAQQMETGSIFSH